MTSVPGEITRKVRFFASYKFTVGLLSCLYLGTILFFIALAVILPLKKSGTVRAGDFFFIGLPAWVLLFIGVYGAVEAGTWWIFPHWFWTAVKRVKLKTGTVSFITGWIPFRFKRNFAMDEIASILLTSDSEGTIGKKDRFGLTIRDRRGNSWSFFDGFRDELLFRQRARALTRLLIDLEFTAAEQWQTSLHYSQAAPFALAAVSWDIPLTDTALGYAWNWLENMVAAAVKLVPLGQTAGQRVQLVLARSLSEAVQRGLALDDAQIGASAPCMALASSLHETQYTRLFRS